MDNPQYMSNVPIAAGISRILARLRYGVTVHECTERLRKVGYMGGHYI